MNILIVDDDAEAAEDLKNALFGLGQVVVCTSTCPDQKTVMPPIEVVLTEIKYADVILLDHELVGADYNGLGLMVHCSGKAVIGISNICNLGEVNYHLKNLLPDPEEAGRLRELVLKSALIR